MKRAFWGLWAVAFVLGLIGVYLRVFGGKEVVGYNSYIPWGLWVAMYIYFVGLSAGAFLLSTLVYVFGVKRLEPVGKLALFTALVTLLSALVTIWFDIGHMGRFWKVFTSFAWESMMAWMIWLYTAYFILLIVEIWFALRADLASVSRRLDLVGGLARLLTMGRTDASAAARARDARALKVLGSLGIPLAVAFHGGVGALFGVVGARPYWHSALYPILFLVSALASGGALLTFVVAFLWPQRGSAEHRDLVVFLGQITLGVFALDLLFEWAEFSITLYASIPSHAEGFRLVLFGPYWWVFWIAHLALGAAVPLAILILRGRSVPWVGLAALLLVGSFFAIRLNIVVPGLAVPELQGLERAYADARLHFDYFPSMAEWLVAVFSVSLGIGLFGLGLRILPIAEVAKEA
jgi:molybdopterin-containing oxidoreductase family membrane subunit